MSIIVGIDLGTTFSAIGQMTDAGPRLIPNALGDILTPSVVGIDPDGGVLVGRAASELQVVRPERSVGLFKRYMGTDWTIALEGQKFTPEELSSLVLGSLKRDAEAYLGQPVERAVITVPAYFNDHQRKSTLEAGRIAGFTVERILNEPTAAAIAYGLHEIHEERILLVLDLGGGTFDVSVVELFEGTIEVRASSGETFLGGEDFTTTMAARILESRGRFFEHTETHHPRLISRLRQECEQAKRRLSRQTEVEVRIPNDEGEFPDTADTATVSREQFDRWTSHLVTRLEAPIRRALGDANLSRTDIDDVILVGGATRMGAVAQRAAELFGRPPSCRLNPDEVVALGATVQAGLIARDVQLKDLVVTDVAPFTLGIEVSKDLGAGKRDGYFLPIINRNTTIPISRVERVYTSAPNQTEVTVTVYQGEGRRVDQNLCLGEFTVHDVPRGPAGRPIDVRFTYDLNGVLEVEATVVETSARFTHVIARHARGKSDQEIARALAAMQSLKSHPREEAVNRFLIRRAERLFKELPSTRRRMLDSLLTGFEGALELQDKAAIESNRAELEEYLNQHDGEGPDDHDDDDEDWR